MGGIGLLAAFGAGIASFLSPCAEVKSGTKVTVRGVIQADGSIKATSVAKQ